MLKSSHSTLEHTYTQIPRDQHLQSTVILERSYLPTDTKVSDIESPPFGADIRQQIDTQSTLSLISIMNLHAGSHGEYVCSKVHIQHWSIHIHKSPGINTYNPLLY